MEINATILFQILNFAIFFFVISRFFIKPVKAILEKRQAQIKQEFDDVESLKAQALDLKEDYESKLRNAKSEAQEIVSNAVSYGEMTKNNIINEARDEAMREKERAAEEIRLQQDKAQKELRVQTAELAISIAGKVLKETVDSETQGKTIEEFVRKVGSSR